MQDILKPVVVLAAWTMIMWIWMYATRIPAMNRAKLDAANMVGTTGRSSSIRFSIQGNFFSKTESKWLSDLKLQFQYSKNRLVFFSFL